jgi:hypothetical protein
MTVMKIMSIIGIIWFILCLILSLTFADYDPDASIGWGIFGLLYAVSYSIVGLTTSLNSSKRPYNVTLELIKLAELKEKGLITNEEYLERKVELLKM